METMLALVVGVLIACAVYLILRRDLVRVMLGLIILANAVNLLIFTAGRLTRESPPLVPDGLKVPTEVIANPLPQALILTAIVIGFSLLAFALVLTYRAYATMNTIDVDAMRESEPLYADESRADAPNSSEAAGEAPGAIVATQTGGAAQ